jgi:PKD repeat protein
VFAPWLSWGPYLWTDGRAGRSDGLKSNCPDDLQADFTHPSANGGVPKVARQLLAFFKTDPTAAPWFLKPTANPPALIVEASASNGVAPLTVNFTATATSSAGPVNNFAWTYDDGDFADAQNPTKVFTAPGVYHVHVTAEDGLGNAVTSIVTIQVAVQPATLQFTSVERSGADLKMNWVTRSGESYVVQAATKLVVNSSTNFFDISSLIQAPPVESGSTGYIDSGVLTNRAGRYYRLRLGP